MSLADKERVVLATALENFPENPSPTLRQLLIHAPESFDDFRNGQLAAVMRELWLAGKPVYSVSVCEQIGRLNGKSKIDGAYIVEITNSATIESIASREAQDVWESYQQRKSKTLFLEAAASIDSNPDRTSSIIKHVRVGLDGLTIESDGLLDRIRDRRFNVHVKPAPVVPRFFINGIGTCTPGNITAVSSIPKGGKSAWVSAMVSSIMAVGERDCLSVTSSNPNSGAVIRIDTEQSIEDHDALERRTLARAGLSDPPSWYRSYCLTGFAIADARAAVTMLLAEAAKECGSVHSLLIDGVADMAFDVNDPAEAASLVTEWHGLAIKYHCPIIGVIHLNPGTEKTRGHLGSQLERKSETNLRLEKDGETVVVWADKNRRAPITKAHGPRFAWSEELQMHVSVESQDSAKEKAERSDLIELAEAVFAEHPAMRRMELETTIKKRVKVSGPTAYRKAGRMIDLAIIKKSVAGLYTFNGSTE